MGPSKLRDPPRVVRREGGGRNAKPTALQRPSKASGALGPFGWQMLPAARPSLSRRESVERVRNPDSPRLCVAHLIRSPVRDGNHLVSHQFWHTLRLLCAFANTPNVALQWPS